ncbi:predicted protein [Lichtheimia corymbifera JMRC:FSU:9682]|uniref:Uncharacterized protein n=1 Tax=Lichtheimia corymbifera JMRC:FSU:9682 TaxID=1263082 RepID=A0A068RFR7_9FUNG|nr:predicted protein [Lichtheimia corymbifera JMRC:FSU:9682]
MTKRGLISSRMEKSHISSDGWMHSSAVMRYLGMLLWFFGASSAGTTTWIRLRMIMDWMGCFTAMDVIGTLKSMHAAAILQSWMKDVDDLSNQEYNGTVTPVILYVIHP